MSSPIRGRASEAVCPDVDRFSQKFGTPISIIDKIHQFSPRKTTCDKNKDLTESPIFCWIAHSSAKRIKRFCQTPVSIFKDSNEKQSDLKQRSDEYLLFTSTILTADKNDFFLEDLDLNQMNINLFETQNIFAVDLVARNLSSEAHFRVQDVVPQESTSKESRQKQEPGKCNCRFSQCLKMYCDCLKRGEFCVDCNCIDCENTQESVVRRAKLESMIEKQKKSIHIELGHPDSNLKTKVLKNGCNCRKNSCKKNYCECHQFGFKCSKSCRCFDCKNGKFDELEERS